MIRQKLYLLLQNTPNVGNEPLSKAAEGDSMRCRLTNL